MAKNERPAGGHLDGDRAETRRAAHPPCARCRHEMTWGRIADGTERINGLCLRGHKHWPDGCGHYAER